MNSSKIPNIDQNIITTIKQEVEDIVPFDEIEQAHRQDVLDWLASGANPFRLKKPAIPPKHLVSYFVLIDPDHGSLLLVDHIKAQLWLPSGGHVQLNELPREAVLREAKEEFGIDAFFYAMMTSHYLSQSLKPSVLRQAIPMLAFGIFYEEIFMTG